MKHNASINMEKIFKNLDVHLRHTNHFREGTGEFAIALSTLANLLFDVFDTIHPSNRSRTVKPTEPKYAMENVIPQREREKLKIEEIAIQLFSSVLYTQRGLWNVAARQTPGSLKAHSR